MPYATRIVSQAVAAPAAAVYEFARTMEHLPRWASGLASGIEQQGDGWFADSPMGRIRIAMAPRNDFGVLDHDVTLPDGTTVHNALRVMPAGADGCLLSFVLLRMPGTTDDAFEQDAAHVARDLKALKGLMEKKPGG